MPFFFLKKINLYLVLVLCFSLKALGEELSLTQIDSPDGYNAFIDSLFDVGKNGEYGLDARISSLASIIDHYQKNEIPDDTTLVSVYNYMAFLHYRIDPIKLDSIARIAQKKAEKINDEYGKINSEFMQAFSLDLLGEFDQALTKYFEVQTKMQELKFLKDLPRVMEYIGIVYRMKGEFDQSLAYYFEALKGYEQLGDSTRIGNILNSIGNSYFDISDFEKAEEYYKKSLANKRLFGSKLSVANTLGNLAGIERQKGNYLSALEQSLEVLEIMKSLNNRAGIGVSYMTIGDTYELLGELELAIENMEEGLKYTRELGYKEALSSDLRELARLNIKTSRFERAKGYLIESEHIAIEIGGMRALEDAYLMMFKLDSIQRNYLSAISYYQKYKLLRDSAINDESVKKIVLLEAEYEAEKELDSLQFAEQNERLILKSEITQQTIQRNALLVGLGLLGVISLLIYRSQQIKVRTNRQLRETEELKTRWFVNVSHELKTPLTLVQGPLKNLMEEENMNEFQKKDLRMANRNLEQLNGLVNEILDLSKLEEGKLDLETNNTSMSTLLKTVTASFESLAKSNRVKLEAEVTEELWMEVDRGKLRKLIENLISNALKFTHEGGEIITRLEKKNEAVSLSVEDTGEGISEEDLAHVFERFYQSANKKKSRQGGTGIGLSLSSEVAHLHGGKLTVTSVEGEGSTFTLILPLALIRDAEVKQDDPIIEEAEKEVLYVSRLKEKPKLLLVEDNADMQAYLESLLKKYYRVRIARDGKEGVKKLIEEMPDLIISDVMMPRMDGIELMKEVKSHKEWSQLPFIALTALNSDEERLQALRTGIDDYLAKPFNPEELLVRASNLLQNRDNREDDSEPSEEAFDDKLLRELEETVKEYISDHRLSVSLLAERGAMSESSLRRFLKKSTGLSPLDFIQEIKLQRAMQLLENRVYRTVKEVAAAVGFDRPSRFSAVFEKRYGKRPTDYIT